MTTSKWYQFNNKTFNFPLFYWSYWEQKKLMISICHGGSKSEIHKWHFAHVPQTIVQLNAWHKNNLKLVTSHDEKKTTTNKRAWFYQRLIRLDTKTRRCKRFQTVATGSKIQPRCVGLVIGMDWSFCRFLIALSTAIRLMTTASSAIASRFTWRNMVQDKQVKKKATTVHLGSRLKISGCFRCYPKLPSKKKRRGWNAFCSQEGLVSACFRFSESERSMTFVTRSSSSARTQRSSLSPCHDLFPHEITLEVFFFCLPCHL